MSRHLKTTVTVTYMARPDGTGRWFVWFKVPKGCWHIHHGGDVNRKMALLRFLMDIGK